jgi:hypothetical protein
MNICTICRDIMSFHCQQRYCRLTQSVLRCLYFTFISQPGSQWIDGPCRTCTCEGNAAGSHHPVCRVQDCSDILNEKEVTEYELEKVLVPSQCCPSIVRTACKEGDTVHKVHTHIQVIIQCFLVICIFSLSAAVLVSAVLASHCYIIFSGCLIFDTWGLVYIFKLITTAPKSDIQVFHLKKF